ncbi:MAG: hypothetical protein EPN24_00400 [Candidatus Methanoperedens sp.]|nr:MAG: hypothetical protein EPN24_00400 [Candidatus Methanoperedens sp.]
MKQQDLYKLLAFFLAFTMIFSIFAYIFINPKNDTQQQTENQTQNVYDPEFWTFDQPFDSISDALNMTPPGAINADFIDLESMTPQMAEWTTSARPILAEVDSIYRSNTTKMFYTDIKYGNNRSFLLLSTMDPLKNDFEYIVSPYYYDYHPLLIRQEGGLQGFYNVMGTPVILAPQQTVIDVLDITTSLNETVTSYDKYKGLLSKVPDAPFQTITSNVSFAKQYYMGIRLTNGSYERTTAYLDLNSSVMKKLDQLRTNSTQRGISQYNVTKSGNYTIIQISSGDMAAVLMEEAN